VNLSHVREVVAAQIKAGVDRDVNVSPYVRPIVNPPAVMIDSRDPYVEYHGSFGARTEATVFLTVWCVGGRGNDEDCQRVVDELLSSGASSPRSVMDALEVDRTFGGEFPEGCVVKFAGGIQLIGEDDPNVRLFGAPLQLDIHLRRDRKG
jgi:hypothetical protein